MTGIQTGTNWKFMLQRCPLIYGFTTIGHFGKVGNFSILGGRDRRSRQI